MRFRISAAVVLAFTFSGALVSGIQPEARDRSVSVGDLDPYKGTVKDVKLNGDRATILVEKEVKGGMDLVRFHLTKNTPIVFLDKKKATANDLKVGQIVTVRTTSDVLDSWPPQMDADAIVIEAGKQPKQ